MAIYDYEAFDLESYQEMLAESRDLDALYDEAEMLDDDEEAAMYFEAQYEQMLHEQAAERAMSAHAMGFRPERLDAPECDDWDFSRPVAPDAHLEAAYEDRYVDDLDSF